MKMRKRIAIMLTFSVAFCFGLVSMVQSDEGNPNENGDKNISIWGITYEGTDEWLEWEENEPNSRFAIHDSETPGQKADDLVLDKETGLIWARDANHANGPKSWQHAILFCRNVSLGNRKGWRLPSVSELASLVDPSKISPTLPEGHPFINVQARPYWSNTLYETITTYAWGVNLSNGYVRNIPRKNYNFVWPVRGGS